ncbi:MAG TPA: CHAT domain-containing protein [Thermoanaerobaculia bacterium]|nr:CHAT domain-containing protein [Thermoanaerobaculia bacterium]
MTDCIDAETLALFAEGKLSRAELKPVLEHVTSCASCMRIVKIAGEEWSGGLQPAGDGRAEARRSTYWLAAAAAILVLLAIPMIRRLRVTPEEQLVELAPRSARVTETRLSGDFAYAPWKGPIRSDAGGKDAAAMELVGVAGRLMQRADRERTADAQHEAGVALTLIDEPLNAVARLRDAATRAPNDARIHSDLAAAQYAAATRLGRPALLPEALASADRAIRLDARLAEALFNRAVILEGLGLSQQAREAWQRYLEVDPSSPWAAEARARLSHLPATTGDSLFRRDLPLLERAAETHDAPRVERLVARYPQQARTFAEAEYLGRWGEARQRGDEREAARLLAIATSIGDALVKVNGESLLRDAVRAVAQNPQTLAEAHALYRRGRIAYSKQQPSAAEPELRRAAALFANARSPMALVARYFAASARFDRNDVDGADDELAQLLDEVDARPGAIALGAQVRWELALCRMQQDDWPGSLPLLQQSVRAFRALGEQSNLGFVQTLAGDALLCLARPDEGWTARIESFRIQSAEGRGDRLPVSVGGAARRELRAGRYESARALLGIEDAAERAIGNDALLANTLVREAALASVLGDRAAATQHVDEAARVAGRVADPAMRQRALIDVDFARGAVLLDEQPRAAIEALTRAIDGYASVEKPFFLPESHLLRSRARARSGDAAGAAADAESGIAQLERYRIHYAGAIAGTGIFDASRALFRQAMTLALARGDSAAAFAYEERSRAHLNDAPASAEEIRRRLAGSGAAVLEIAAADDEVITFCVTERELAAHRTRIELGVLAQLAQRGDREARARLYDVLVRPCQPALAGARHLIVVSDPSLEAVPFGALYDNESRSYLIERAAVSVAMSASSLQRVNRSRPSSVVAMALPSGEGAGSAALPRAALELKEVRGLYPRTIEAPQPSFAALAATTADVVHITGHTQRRMDASGAGLRFEERDWASWRSIAASRFAPASTIVLAACESLRRPAPAQGFALSLGDAFLAAGAGDVIGTLDVIADNDAYELFTAVHRELAAGASADDAVRRAQLAMIASRRPVAWQSVAVLTRQIPEEKEKSWAH